MQADPVATVGHKFREERGYEVDDGDIVYNFVRMLALHFDCSMDSLALLPDRYSEPTEREELMAEMSRW